MVLALAVFFLEVAVAAPVVAMAVAVVDLPFGFAGGCLPCAGLATIRHSVLISVMTADDDDDDDADEEREADEADDDGDDERGRF